MHASQPFSYLAPKTGQAAPKTGYRKEEGIYGDLTASVTGLNQQQPPSAASGGVSGGNGMPPPVAAKPMMMRHDRPSGFDADWRLRGGDTGYGDAPKPVQLCTLVLQPTMQTSFTLLQCWYHMVYFGKQGKSPSARA